MILTGPPPHGHAGAVFGFSRGNEGGVAKLKGAVEKMRVAAGTARYIPNRPHVMFSRSSPYNSDNRISFPSSVLMRYNENTLKLPFSKGERKTVMKKLLLFLLLIVATAAYIFYDNGRLSVTDYSVSDSRIPESFDGVKIVQVSDVHDAEFGGEQADLIETVRRENPDYIFLTGDFIDSNRYDLDRSMSMIPALTGMAEVFYVTGNHEVATNEVEEITSALLNAGVRVLRNQAMVVGSGNGSIAIAGIDDPLTGVGMEGEDAFTRHAIERATANVPEGMFTILLAHRPEQFGTYAEMGIPLVFSGHAHGGQVRIPFVGGLNSPGQGWFPELTSGIHEQGNTRLVISRGIGNSQIPLRLLNTPEIVSVTLQSE